MHLLFLKENDKAWNIYHRIKEKQDFILRGPYGRCTLRYMAANRPIIFIARGTGFSPVKAVIEALIQQPTYPSIHFYCKIQGEF